MPIEGGWKPSLDRVLQRAWLSSRQDHVYGYQLGLFIELDTKRTAYLIEVYREGAKVDELRGHF